MKLIYPTEDKCSRPFAAIYLLGIGLSHVAQPLVWVEFFTWLRDSSRKPAWTAGIVNLGSAGSDLTL